MDKDRWGPAGWTFLEACALGYPANPSLDDRARYAAFFGQLGGVLPCSACAEHYNEVMLHVAPLVVAPDRVAPGQADHLASPDDLLRWVIGVHNVVRVRQGKRPLPLDQARCHVMGWKSGGGRSSALTVLLALTIAVTAALALLRRSR